MSCWLEINKIPANFLNNLSTSKVSLNFGTCKIPKMLLLDFIVCVLSMSYVHLYGRCQFHQVMEDSEVECNHNLGDATIYEMI